MKKIQLKRISKHMKDRKVIRSSRHQFTKGKSSVTHLIAFYSETTGLVNEVNAVDAVYLDLSKPFDVVCHNILIDKLTKYRLNKWKVRWIENCLNSWAQRLLIHGAQSSWRQVTSGVLQRLILGLILFSIFPDELCAGTESILSKFAVGMKL